MPPLKKAGRDLSGLDPSVAALFASLSAASLP